MRKRTDNPQSEVCREALGGVDQEVASDKKQELIWTSNLVAVGAGGIPLQSTVEQVYQNWGVYMVGTEVYILFYLRTDHVHRPCMLLFVHE